MRRPKKEPTHPPVVYLEWVDAGSSSPGWQDEDDVPGVIERMGRPLTAAGFLISKGKDSVLLALAYNSNNGDVSGLFYVPRSNIQRMVVVKRQAGMKLVDR